MLVVNEFSSTCFYQVHSNVQNECFILNIRTKAQYLFLNGFLKKSLDMFMGLCTFRQSFVHMNALTFKAEQKLP